MYYFGFIYAFRNYGEMGGDYPLATYTFQVGLNKTKTQLDSVCKAKQFSFTTTFDTTGAFPDYYSIVINHKQDSLAFQIWLKPVLRDSVTELYLLQVEDKNRSVSYQSTKANDKAFVLRLRSKLEKELLSEMKGIH